MKVEELMTRDVWTCRPGDTLSTAVQLMWDGDCGCIPVVSDDDSRRVVGMITDRDICMATHFRACRPGEIKVEEAMSKCLRTVGAAEDIADADAIMRDVQVRRLPVVDASQRLLGLVSLADLAREADHGRRTQPRTISDQEVGETLGAICTSSESWRRPLSA